VKLSVLGAGTALWQNSRFYEFHTQADSRAQRKGAAAARPESSALMKNNASAVDRRRPWDASW
jgi:hypothetical protein